MEIDTLLEVVRENNMTLEQIKDLKASMEKVSEYLDSTFKETIKKETFPKEVIENSITKYNMKAVKMFNTLLVNLVSKRTILKVDDNKYIAFGTAGISDNKIIHPRYQQILRNMRFDYLPKYSLSSPDTIKAYALTLANNGSRINGYVKKTDKKEILKICTKFAKEYLKITQTNSSDTMSILNVDEHTIRYVEHSYWRDRARQVCSYKYNKVNVIEKMNGIEITLIMSGVPRYKTCSINSTMGFNDISLFLSFKEQNPEVYAEIKEMYKEISAKNDKLRELINGLEEELKGYLLMELL